MVIEDNFSYFSLKLYIMTRHLRRRIQMRGHNICINAEQQNFPELSSNPLIYLECWVHMEIYRE